MTPYAHIDFPADKTEEQQVLAEVKSSGGAFHAATDKGAIFCFSTDSDADKFVYARNRIARAAYAQRISY